MEFQRKSAVVLFYIVLVAECYLVDTHNSNVRLEGGSRPDEGRVEVLRQGVWGTICDDEANIATAEVICGQIGFSLNSLTVSVKPNAFYGQGTGPISQIECSGQESSLDQCVYSMGTPSCSHKEDLGVICRYTELPFRMSNTSGLTSNQGRLEVNVNGTWVNVCDDGFTDNSASVACQMFGFKRENAKAVSHSYFGSGEINQVFHLDEVRCKGQENSLMECQHRTVGHTDCYSTEAVGIICN